MSEGWIRTVCSWIAMARLPVLELVIVLVHICWQALTLYQGQ